MGNSSNLQEKTLKKGEGYRILKVMQNSPFDELVQMYFDFIIDVIPKQSEIIPQTCELKEYIAQKANTQIQLKVVSTKFRNIRNIKVTPNTNWNGSNDLMGIQYRIQSFNDVFDQYCQIIEIAHNSPIKLAGIIERDYMLGCKQIVYSSINELIDKLYQRYFDPNCNNIVHFAIFRMVDNQVKVLPVQLKRKWGGHGLLGCQFMEGMLYKFPHNFQEYRKKFMQQHQTILKKNKVRQELQVSNGASKSLLECLKSLKAKQFQLGRLNEAIKVQPPQNIQHINDGKLEVRIQKLQEKMGYIQQTLNEIKNICHKIGE